MSNEQGYITLQSLLEDGLPLLSANDTSLPEFTIPSAEESALRALKNFIDQPVDATRGALRVQVIVNQIIEREVFWITYASKMAGYLVTTEEEANWALLDYIFQGGRPSVPNSIKESLLDRLPGPDRIDLGRFTLAKLGYSFDSPSLLVNAYLHFCKANDKPRSKIFLNSDEMHTFFYKCFRIFFKDFPVEQVAESISDRSDWKYFLKIFGRDELMEIRSARAYLLQADIDLV